MLSFELNTQTYLTDGIFDPNIPDSSQMQVLDRDATIQLTDIINKSIFPTKDSILLHCCYENTFYFIYGKLNLQPNVKSIVIWEFDRDIYHNTDHSKHLWLFNLKGNQVCSIVWLDYLPGMLIDAYPSVTTFLKDKIFTTTSTSSIYVSWLEDPIASAFHNHLKIIDDLVTHYRVDKDGFVEFAKN
ncbi:hypothetical protein AGMMS50262_14640 [Bacteroidia bacterium]|nr:hypothetical protein AGMMS50262_14640 [Bacteroidia bacterium]